MIAYTEKTTEELIELLVAEEDRVTLEHIQVLVARPDAAEPLRRLLQDDYYWYDADLKESWSLYHAFIVLCLKRDQEALPILLDSLKKAHETDYDYLTEISHAALAHYGESAVDVLIEFVKELKGKHEDDWVMTYPRSDAVTALSRIAFENPAVHSRIADFVFGLLIDKAETDSDFLSFICDDAVLLDRERGLAAVQAAYEHGLIDDSINGDFEFFKQDIDSGNNVTESKYRRDVFDFYRPEEIASRQKQWQQAAENLKRLQAEKEIRAGETTNKDNWFAEEVERGLPAGFTVTEAGNFVREEKIGRNDPCPCGSGKKYKKCHGK